MAFRFPRSRSNQAPDIELGLTNPQHDFINGYPSASKFIASDPDHSFSIYRAFHKLTTRNLLYLEAEVLELQKWQDDMDIEDSWGNQELLQSFRSWKKLSTSNNERSVERMELVGKIRRTLKEYRRFSAHFAIMLNGMLPRT